MLGWVRTILLVGFSSNSKKEAPIGVPGTSIRSVPTLTGEGINTHTPLMNSDNNKNLNNNINYNYNKKASI